MLIRAEARDLFSESFASNGAISFTAGGQLLPKAPPEGRQSLQGTVHVVGRSEVACITSRCPLLRHHGECYSFMPSGMGSMQLATSPGDCQAHRHRVVE